MPILTNPKRELFAQELAKGTTCEAAYVAAGYARHEQNARRLKANDAIRSRVAELQAEGAEKAGITIARVLDELGKIAFADITEAVEWGEAIPTPIPDMDDCVFIQGVRMKASEDLPKRVTAAISEVRRTKEGIAIKFHSKTAAAEMIGRHLGMFKDKVEVSADMTLEQLVLGAMKHQADKDKAGGK